MPNSSFRKSLKIAVLKYSGTTFKRAVVTSVAFFFERVVFDWDESIDVNLATGLIGESSELFRVDFSVRVGFTVGDQKNDFLVVVICVF